MNRRNALASLVSSVCVLLALSFEQNSLAKQSRDDKTVVRKQVPLTGHVLARVEHLTGYLVNSLGGQRYDVFVFGTDNGEKQESPPVPVKVVYEFYRDEPNLPEKFFDFSSHYELTVVRDAGCDESVKSLSCETDLEQGKPPSPRYILRVLNRAPTDVLKPDLILACYVLRPGQYATLSNRKVP
jgi:hypothetical protein